MGFNIVDKLLAMTLLGSEWVLWLLLILSVVSVAIILERALFFYKMRLDFPAFADALVVDLQRKDTEAARKLCEGNPAIEAQVALRALTQADKGLKVMEESMSGFLIGERQYLDRGLVVLGTLGNNAPFIGLFGTVIGIIQAFDALASNPGGGPSVVMAGISEALVATAVGLLVAIPAVIAFNGFQRVVKRRVANAEAVIKLISAAYHS